MEFLSHLCSDLRPNCTGKKSIVISVVIYVQNALEKKDFHFNVGKQKFSMVLLDPSLITETPLIIKHVLFQRI